MGSIFFTYIYTFFLTRPAGLNQSSVKPVKSFLENTTVACKFELYKNLLTGRAGWPVKRFLELSILACKIEVYSKVLTGTAGWNV